MAAATEEEHIVGVVVVSSWWWWWFCSESTERQAVEPVFMEDLHNDVIKICYRFNVEAMCTIYFGQIRSSRMSTTHGSCEVECARAAPTK